MRLSNHSHLFFLLFVICCASFIHFVASQSTFCEKINPCRCRRQSDGYEINLESLSPKDGSSAFSDYDPHATTTKYIWNPCFSLTECLGEKDSSLCQLMTSILKQQFQIGTLATAVFKPPTTIGSEARIEYTSISQKDGKLRKSYVDLQCDKTSGAVDEFTSKGENPELVYGFNFRSKVACFQPGQGGGGDGGWSLGDWLLLIFFLAIILYLILGITFNIFYKKSSGVEIVPNVYVWIVVPGLIKEGALFIWGLARGQKMGYSEAG
jgi:hypothetical protein